MAYVTIKIICSVFILCILPRDEEKMINGHPLPRLPSQAVVIGKLEPREHSLLGSQGLDAGWRLPGDSKRG